MLIIDIKVVPSAGRTAWKYEAGVLKCYLTSPPEKGKANQELIGLLAKALGIKSSAVTIILGATVRKKRVRIDAPITMHDVLKKLGIMEQLTIFKGR